VRPTPINTIGDESTKKDGSPVKDNFVRIEVGGVAVNRSGGTVRTAIREGKVPAIRDGRNILVDLAALKARFAPRPVVPAAMKASQP
jgi:hypothetical protein